MNNKLKKKYLRLFWYVDHIAKYLNFFGEGNGVAGDGEDIGKAKEESENRGESDSDSWSALWCRFCLRAIPLFIPVRILILSYPKFFYTLN